MAEVQGTLNFPSTFEIHKGTCTCGQLYECKKNSIVLEMSILCQNCGKIIFINNEKK